MQVVNRRIALVVRPVGLPKVSDFDLTYAPLGSPSAGQVLVRSIYLSLDPSLRRSLNRADSGGSQVALGEVLPGGAVARVLESADPAFRVGDVVQGMLGWQEYAICGGNELRRVDSNLAPISTALGVLGTPGLTAYFGLLDVCDVQPGETVVVSGAAGGIGMIVGQIAKARGCRVVGLAGPDVKVQWLLDELGFDAAFNVRTVEDLRGHLLLSCPDGVDVYFDSVGGETTDQVMQRLNPRARISVCGQLSQDSLEEPASGPRWLGELIVKQVKMQGFLVSAYTHRFPEAMEHLARWLGDGTLEYREDVAQGLEAAPQAFIGVLQGKNQGKQLVQLAAA